MARQLVKRIYVQRREYPDINLWLEYGAIESENPMIHFYCNGEDGQKERLLSIGMATAIRMVKALDMICGKLNPIEDKEWEETDDPVGDC